MRQFAGRVAAVVWAATWAAGATPPEPKLQSLQPLAGRPGTVYQVVITGTGLASLEKLFTDGPGIRTRFLAATPESLTAEISLDPSVPPGPKTLRACGPHGVTNSVTWHVVTEPLALEKPDLPLHAPLVVNGTLAEPGEVDQFSLQAPAGASLTFEVISGTPTLDPVVTLLEPATDSWFAPTSWKRLAFNDEDLFFPGLSTQARLTHTVQRAGQYRVQVSGFTGQGGRSASYYLRIRSGPPEAVLRHPIAAPLWNPRSFVRQLGGDWQDRLHQRGGDSQTTPAPTRLPGSEAGQTLLPIPGILEGRLATPATVHRAKLRIEKAMQLVIEIETPEATLPEFNPVVTLFDSTGREVVTNVHTKRNNNGLYMMKMIHAKSTFPLTAPGDYTLQVRDITTDHGRPDFFYRVLLRPQIPHIGRIDFPDDRLNLVPGQTRLITLQLDREEEFRDPVIATIEGLPPGVTVLPAAENPIERPPLPNAGRIERYIPKTQSLSLLLAVAQDAPLTNLPLWPRLVVRPVHQQKLAVPILERPFPLMVVRGTP